MQAMPRLVSARGRAGAYAWAWAASNRLKAALWDTAGQHRPPEDPQAQDRTLPRAPEGPQGLGLPNPVVGRAIRRHLLEAGARTPSRQLLEELLAGVEAAAAAGGGASGEGSGSGSGQGGAAAAAAAERGSPGGGMGEGVGLGFADLDLQRWLYSPPQAGQPRDGQE